MPFLKLINILLIEDETFDVNRVKRTLSPFEDNIIIRKVVADGQSAINALSENEGEFDVIIMDYQIAGKISGEGLITKLKAIDPFIQIIVITKMTINVTDFEFANKLIEAGATWFGTKYPADIKDYIYQPTDLLLAITNAYEKKCLTFEKSQSNDLLNSSIENILIKNTLLGILM
ncbi:MAG: response regulator [Ignavibacteriales bacterium]|nr:response regulator [Ignavibacteriales bacterium]